MSSSIQYIFYPFGLRSVTCQRIQHTIRRVVCLVGNIGGTSQLWLQIAIKRKEKKKKWSATWAATCRQQVVARRSAGYYTVRPEILYIKYVVHSRCVYNRMAVSVSHVYYSDAGHRSIPSDVCYVLYRGTGAHYTPGWSKCVLVLVNHRECVWECERRRCRHRWFSGIRKREKIPPPPPHLLLFFPHCRLAVCRLRQWMTSESGPNFNTFLIFQDLLVDARLRSAISSCSVYIHTYYSMRSPWCVHFATSFSRLRWWRLCCERRPTYISGAYYHLILSALLMLAMSALCRNCWANNDDFLHNMIEAPSDMLSFAAGIEML